MAGNKTNSIAVLGAGSWGTALAIHLSQNGVHTTLWSHRSEHAKEMSEARANMAYLPGVRFPAGLKMSASLEQAIHGVQDILLVVPSHAFRATLCTLAPFRLPHQRIIWGTKGFEVGTHKLLHQIVAEELGSETPAAVISGPTFAKEVAAGLPTAVTVASMQDDFADDLAQTLHSETFRAYTSQDIVGVEVGGAVKNVLAIAAGIGDGLGFGANTRSALITRGLVEVMRLGVTLGAERETFMGLAGLGDLVLTCTDDQSRNRRMGLALGRGQSMEQALIEIAQVVEGVATAKEVHQLAKSLGVDMPITEEVYNVLHKGKPAKQAVHDLFMREQKAETIL